MPQPSPPLPPPPLVVRNCTESYGFLPCSDNTWGALFLAFVYGYAVLRGAMMIGDGGESLMDLKLAPAIIGGLVLPVIGALPDALIIINSGLHQSRSEAREEIAVGMGTLAGSTVMLLTIVWGGSVLLGRCDLDPASGLQRDRARSHPWYEVLRVGVSTDAATPRSAWAMLITAGLYLVVQVPALFVKSTKHAPVIPLVGCICCFVALVVYCCYQIATPAAQRRRILAVHKHALRFHAVRSFSFAAQRWGGLVDTGGAVRREVTSKIFHRFRRDECGCLDASDVRSMLIGLEIAKPRWRSWSTSSNGSGPNGTAGGASGGSVSAGLDARKLDDHVALWMREFDPQGTGHISEEQFHEGVTRWVAYKMRRSPLAAEPKHAKHRAKDPAGAAHALLIHLDDSAMPLLADSHLSGSGSDIGDPMTEDSDLESGLADAASASAQSAGSGGDGGPPPPPWRVALDSAVLLTAGTALCGVFADPLVGSVTDVSRATGVAPFFLAFVFMPLASNASELVSSLAFAAGRTSNRISVTFNQVYGAVVMNSTLCLGSFLAIIYARRLPWTFASEVLVILLPTLLLGAFAVRRRSWPAAWGAGALAMYPLVLWMQYLLMPAARA